MSLLYSILTPSILLHVLEFLVLSAELSNQKLGMGAPWS